VYVAVPFIRRVGVRVAGGVPRVALPGGMSVPVMLTVLVKSRVGVSVGNSRVGIGAWVGVATRVPPGKLMNVGGGLVEVGSNAGRVTIVGVGARWLKFGRTRMLNVPAQYITIAPITTIARQP
jgi:hypothetical protein